MAGDREAKIDRLLVEVYTRTPAQDVWGEEAAKRLIAAEPWGNRGDVWWLEHPKPGADRPAR